MRENGMETKSFDDSDAVAFISQQMQECMAMGANDSEAEDFRYLIEGVNSGKIDPTEAKRQALAIRQGKMDYH